MGVRCTGVDRKTDELKIENFAFATLVFAYFTFTILNFDILLWSYSLLLRSKTKSETTIKGAKAKQKLIIFILGGFAPHGTKIIHYQELAGQKQNAKI
jgi:hypothetical protein